jgi:hypothetical protein
MRTSRCNVMMGLYELMSFNNALDELDEILVD